MTDDIETEFEEVHIKVEVKSLVKEEIEVSHILSNKCLPNNF